MTKTLLSIVQEILSDMESDNVNSVNDTVESLQVATIVKSSYEYLQTIIDLPTENILTQLIGLADVDKPTHMKIPDSISLIEWVKYDKESTSDTDLQLKEICYLTPTDFHDKVSRRNESDTEVIPVVDYGNTSLLIKTDKNPTYWTSFDDKYIVFDSYDNTVDSTIHESKSAIYGTKRKSFTISDSFTPDLPDKFFPLLIAESKAEAFAKLKQTSSNRDENKVRKQIIKLQKDKQRTGADHAYNTFHRP